MSDVKISLLPDAQTLDGTEVIPSTQSGNTVKVKISQISAKTKNDILPIVTDDIADKAVSLDKFSDSAKEYIGSGGNITNYPDDVTLESYLDGTINKLRIKSTAAEQLLSVGVTFDWSNTGSALTRVGNSDLLNTIFDAIASPVIIDDSGNVVQELSEDVMYQKNGQSSDLSGTAGQAMVRFKKFYIKRVLDSSNRYTQLSISLQPLAGFIPHEKFSWGNGRDEIFVGMYEASLVSSKMASVSGQSIYSNVSLATFRSVAAARGTGWHDYDYLTQDLLQTLWYVFFCDMNSQVSLPGYAFGYGTQSWLRPTGRTKALTSKNGYVVADSTNDSDIYSSSNWQDTAHVIANRFLWVENLYGHTWKMMDGVSYDGTATGNKHAFMTANPNLFTSDPTTIVTNYKDMGVALVYSTNESWIKSFGMFFQPIEFGGGSNYYICDYFWAYLNDNTRNYFRLVLWGGSLSDGIRAGVATRSSPYGLGDATWALGSRICFEKN